MKLEYISNNTRRSYVFENTSGLLSTKNIDINYLQDLDYLENPDNGYIVDGEPTEKLTSLLKEVEKINQSTWDNVILDVSRFDRKSVRGENVTAINTYYDHEGEEEVVTGIGDIDDLYVISAETSAFDDIYSKHLFISLMDGYTSSGVTETSIQYSNLMNRTNSENMFTYNPNVQPGYFYIGNKEYFLYPEKQTEIIEMCSGINSIELDNVPDSEYPIFISMNNDVELFDALGAVNFDSFAVYQNNTYYDTFSGVSNYINHDLNTVTPFTYIVTNDNNLIFPDVNIVDYNNTRLITSDVIEGTINIIRPNKKIFQQNISGSSGVTIEHNLNTSVPLFMASINDELHLIDYDYIDDNTVTIPSLLSDPVNVVGMDIEDFSYNEYISGLTSGTIYHNLGLSSTGLDKLDPIVFFDASNGISIPEQYDIQDNSLYFEFTSSFYGDAYIIDVNEINNFYSITSSSGVTINTSHYNNSSQDYYGNNGPLEPWYRTSGLLDNEYYVNSIDDVTNIEDEFDGEPIYEVGTNKITFESQSSGIAIITYGYHPDGLDYHTFNNVDISPLTSNGNDRILSIRDTYEPYNIYFIDTNTNVDMLSLSTREIDGSISPRLISDISTGHSIGEPTNKYKVGVRVEDVGGAYLENIDIHFDTTPKLYDSTGSGLTGYSISILDNTSGLVDIKDDIVLDTLEIDTSSIYNIVSFDNVSGLTDIYDTNGYVFTVNSGITDYIFPFESALYDIYSDSFVHELTKTTNKYGNADIEIGIHNDSFLNVTRNNVITCTFGDITKSLEYTIEPQTLYNNNSHYYSETIPNVSYSSKMIYDENITVIDNERVTSPSLIGVVSSSDYISCSGITDIDQYINYDKIVDVYRYNNGYIVKHDNTNIGDLLVYQVHNNNYPLSFNVGGNYDN